MPRVGEAFYELTARDAGLFGALAKAESGLTSAGVKGEQALGGGVAKGMATAESAVAGGTTRMGGLMSNVGGATTKLTSKMGELKTGIVQGLGIGGFLAVSTAATTFIGKITDSIGLASDLNETISKTQATFGPAAATILAWGKTTSSTMGIAEASALDYSSTFGGLLQNFGMTAQAAAPMSQSLVQLAADMASFSNSTPEEALDALRSGLIGESEPLRRFQVNLSEARIQQKALELGLWSGKGAIDASAKAQATYAIIMADTARQQGDFARTADGMANMQRSAAAKSQEAWTNFGAALLPIANVVMPALANAGTAVINFMTSLFTHGRELAPVLSILGIVVATQVVPPFIAWAAAVVVANAPLIFIALAIAAVVDILHELGLLGPIIDAFWNLIGLGAQVVGKVFETVGALIKGFVSLVIGTVRNVVGIAASIPGPWQAAAQEMQATLQGMQNDVDRWGTDVVEHAGKSADDIATIVPEKLEAGAPAVDAAAKTMTDGIPKAFDTAKKDATASARETPGAIGQALAAGRDAVGSGADALKQAFKDHISPMKEIAQLEADLTGKLMHRGLHSNDPIIRAAAQQWKSDIEDRLFVLRNNVGGIALKTGDNYGDALGKKRGFVLGKAVGIATAATSALSDAAAVGRAAGSALGKLFADGIWSRHGYLYDQVHNYLQSASGQMKASSPPKEGPLHTLDRDAVRTADTYADAFASRSGYLKSTIADFLSAAQLDLGSFSPVVRTAVSPAGMTAMPPAAPRGASVTIGDIHVPVTFTGASPSNAAEVRALGRSLGEEIRLSLTRNSTFFPVRGG